MNLKIRIGNFRVWRKGWKFCFHFPGGYVLAIGAWLYGWDNPQWYKRFDDFRAVCHVWKPNSREGDYFYGARGFDRTWRIRDDGAWQFPKGA